MNDQGGHGVTVTRADQGALLADFFVFALWQSGVPKFQPEQ